MNNIIRYLMSLQLAIAVGCNTSENEFGMYGIGDKVNFENGVDGTVLVESGNKKELKHLFDGRADTAWTPESMDCNWSDDIKLYLNKPVRVSSVYINYVGNNPLPKMHLSIGGKPDDDANTAPDDTYELTGKIGDIQLRENSNLRLFAGRKLHIKFNNCVNNDSKLSIYELRFNFSDALTYVPRKKSDELISFVIDNKVVTYNAHWDFAKNISDDTASDILMDMAYYGITGNGEFDRLLKTYGPIGASKSEYYSEIYSLYEETKKLEMGKKSGKK